MEGAGNVALRVDLWAFGAFAFYLMVMVVIGVLAARFSSAGLDEYFLAGRKLRSFVVALSAVASGRSSWLLLGVTGMAYVRGVGAVWAVVGYILVELFLFAFVGRRLRRLTGASGDITVPDFLESRFEDRSGLLRVVAVTVILIFMVTYVAAQFTAGGKTFAASFGISSFEGVLITAIIVLIYTLLGGFLAVSLTDLLQAIFMITFLVLIPVVAFSKFGGWTAVFSTLRGLDPRLLDPFALSAGVVIGFLGIGFGSPGNPHILVRYMSIRRAGDLRLSALWGTIWNVVMAWGAIYIGLVGRAFYPTKNLLPGADPEKLYPYLAQQHLHPLLFGFVVAAIFAAIMSTADSQLLVAASGVIRDLYQRFSRGARALPRKELVKLSRITVLVLTVLAVLLGQVASKWIFWLVLFAWGGLGASFGPVILLSLYWKRTTRAGALAGIVTGTLVEIVWNQTPALKAIVYELVPAFLLSTLVVIAVSLLTQPPAGVDRLLAIASGKADPHEQREP